MIMFDFFSLTYADVHDPHLSEIKKSVSLREKTVKVIILQMTGTRTDQPFIDTVQAALMMENVRCNPR